MARAGRELERLVEALEAAVSGPEVRITSPDYLVDIVNGDRREVDVSLRTRVGSTEVVVILECRDWSGAQCVAWIEQLATKRNDVRAAKAVAVSSSGFSDLAAKKARFHGIELRVIDEIDAGAVSSWLRLISISAVIPSFEVRSVFVGLAVRPGTPVPEVISSVELGERCLLWHKDGSHKRLADVALSGDSGLLIYRDVPEDGTRVEKKVRIDFDTAPLVASLVAPGGVFPISYLVIDFVFWQTRRRCELHRVVSYRRDDEALIEAAEYLIASGSHEEILSVSRDLKTGIQRFSRRAVVDGVNLPEAHFRMRQVPIKNA